MNTSHYVCPFCQGDNNRALCIHCGGRGWMAEDLLFVEMERQYSLKVAERIVEENPVEQSDSSLTIEQAKEIRIWQESGRVSLMLQDMPNDVLKAMFLVSGLKIPQLC